MRLLVLLACPSACLWASAASAQDAPVRSLIEMRRGGVIMQDWDLSCGAATLATLLTHQLGDPVTEADISRTLINRQEYLDNPLLVRARQGFSFLDLKRYVEGRGYEGTGLGRMQLDDLTQHAPVIVPVRFKRTANHFVVFRGVVGDTVYLADPAYGQRTVSVERFMRVWVDAPEIGRIGFYVREPGRAPVNRMAPSPDEIGGVRPEAVEQLAPIEVLRR